MNDIPLARPSIGDAELAAVAEVFDSGWLAGQGPRGAMLEDGFKQLTGRKHAIALNNCTAGLHLALAGLGVGVGDEVIVSDYSFPATGHAVLYTGAQPVFADVRPDTATIDPAYVESLITARTRGIIAVDALGMPADWADLEAIAARHGLFLVADAACSAGGTYAGRNCGAFGDVAVFSLHARKGITSGEGGVVVTDDDQLAAHVRAASCFGMQSAFDRQASDTLMVPTFPTIGYNYKLSDILAAIAVVQLSRLDEFMKARRLLADRYGELLADVPGVDAPVAPVDRQPAWQTYAVVVHGDRNRLVSGLRNAGIGSNIGTYAMHLQPVYGASQACPVSRHLFEQHAALPMSAELSAEDQLRVVSAVRDLAGR